MPCSPKRGTPAALFGRMAQHEEHVFKVGDLIRPKYSPGNYKFIKINKSAHNILIVVDVGLLRLGGAFRSYTLIDPSDISNGEYSWYGFGSLCNYYELVQD